MRTSFRHFTIGTFAIFSPLVSHFCVSLHYHVYEGKKIVKLVLMASLFGVRFHFFENFWREPMSVDARVILLVGYDKTMYMMVTRVSTKR